MPAPRSLIKISKNPVRDRAFVRFAWVIALTLMTQWTSARADGPERYDTIAPLLKERCVKCHGPAKAEAGLDLSTPAAIARGGESGPVVAPHSADESLLWERVESGEMPPKQPLSSEEKQRIRTWIVAGAPGLPAPDSLKDADHWAFRKLVAVPPPAVRDTAAVRNEIDRFVLAPLERDRLSLAPEASRARLIRRVSLTLTGLPPTPEEIRVFLDDRSADAYAHMVERYLASPRYGERWGKHWLDAAGYADSNGYFNADSDRPLAYRYRDYVIRAFNADKPFDRFLREQIAGDEMPGYVPDQPVPAEVAERLIATHFLRNGQDGSSESDGNPDELRVDRYAALESCQQIVSSALLGLTMQCAKCHAHKFEPITHEDYYRFQAIFTPAFPAAKGELWVKPRDRIVSAPTVADKRLRERAIETTRARVETLQASLKVWTAANRPAGQVVFQDDFDTEPKLAAKWSNVAPGDDRPGGSPPVNVDSDTPPAARTRNGRLEIVAGVTPDSWLTTSTPFDWTPDTKGEAIQATFDLIDNRLSAEGTPAERVGYFLATHDFDDDGPTPGGNVLIDGHPGGPSAVFLDYPGKDAVPKGTIGRTGYVPGRNYGVRVTNLGDGQFRLEHLVDGFPEGGDLRLDAAALPDGGFGFEYHAGRAFVVDNVRVERFDSSAVVEGSPFAAKNGEFRQLNDELEKARKSLAELTGTPPFAIAWTTDVAADPPATHLLERGDYAHPGPVMEPAPPSALAKNGVTFARELPPGSRTTGRRLAFAEWLTDPDEPASSLMARVQVNRIWQNHFGTGIVATPENLGYSGAAPSHPELLDWLALEFVRSGWSVKHIHRLILKSATFRQTSDGPATDDAMARRLARFPMNRLDAESIRDAMLAVTGELDTAMGGPYVSVGADQDGAVTVPANRPGARRRSVYLQQKRTQPVSLLQVFDAPTIVFNSVRRPRTTMPLQALALMNSRFARERAEAFARRLAAEVPDDEPGRIAQAWLVAYGRAPEGGEVAAAATFLDHQAKFHGKGPDARTRAWTDLCQSILISNEFLYLD